MNGHKLEQTAAVLDYIESHLWENLELDAIARAAGYSKYHLHRMFAETVGLTPHDYVQRRRLTEAAELLVFSDTPIVEVAQAAGYESQQAFTAVFRAMYKQTPLAYRRSRRFYPLQLRYTLKLDPSANGQRIVYAAPGDLPGWKNFIPLVIDGFPRLDEASHLLRVKRYIEGRQALLMRDGETIIGAAAFSPQAGSVDFLAVHPQYRRSGAAQALLDFMTGGPFAGSEVSITTFRAGDRADTGQRAAYKRLGFAEAELLYEFGYPVQRLVLPPRREADGHG